MLGEMRLERGVDNTPLENHCPLPEHSFICPGILASQHPREASGAPVSLPREKYAATPPARGGKRRPREGRQLASLANAVTCVMLGISPHPDLTPWDSAGDRPSLPPKPHFPTWS